MPVLVLLPIEGIYNLVCNKFQRLTTLTCDQSINWMDFILDMYNDKRKSFIQGGY